MPTSMDDVSLLQAYADRGDQDAFAQLVRRHGNWLYSAARRQLGDGHLAEDVTQAVFLLLARRAGRLRRYAYLSGWLFIALGYCVRQTRQRQAASRRREQEAATMRPEPVQETSWDEIAPLLERAVGRLGKADRDAILLRFYEQKPLAEVGQLMGTSEEAAKKRVQRAVVRLRGMLERQGVTSTSAGLSAALVGNVVQEAPGDLVGGVMSAIGGSGSAVAGGIAEGAMKMMAVGKAASICLALALAAGIGVAVVAAATATPAPPDGSRSTTTVAQAASQPATRPDRRYLGWIHIRMEKIPEAMQPQNRGGPRVSVTGLAFHLNVEKAIAIKSVDLNTGRTIEWRDGQAQYQAYSSATNELVISELPEALAVPDPTAQPRKGLTPWQIEQDLMAAPTAEGIAAMAGYGCTIDSREEAGLQRFDLSLPGYSGPDSGPKGQPFVTVLMDKQTKMIQRMTGAFGDYAFTYGAPDYQTVYDAGVPKDAKLVDRRDKTSKQAKAILDRLDAHVGAGEAFGNYTAIETETIADRRDAPAEKSVTIYARAGDKRLFMKYWNLAGQDLDLEGWPTPSMPLVESSYKVRPDICFVSDGTQAWFARGASAFETLGRETSVQEWAAGWSLSRSLWPGRAWIDYQHAPRLAIEVQVLDAGSHLGLKVIETGWMNVLPGNPFDRQEQEWRLDPSHDDLPVTLDVKMLKRDGTLLESRQSQFLEYAQLPAGQWYPTLWVEKTNSGGQTHAMEHRLQIFHGEQLAPKWFTDPAQRFPKQPNR